MKRIAGIVAIACGVVGVGLTRPDEPVRSALFLIAMMAGVGLYEGFRLKRFLAAVATVVAVTWLFTLPFARTTWFNATAWAIMAATFFGVCIRNWVRHGDIAGSPSRGCQR